MDTRSAWLIVEARPTAKEIALGLGLALVPATPAQPVEAPHRPEPPGYVCPDRMNPGTCEFPIIKKKEASFPHDCFTQEEMDRMDESGYAWDLIDIGSGSDLNVRTASSFVEELSMAAYGLPIEQITWEQLHALQQALKDTLSTNEHEGAAGGTDYDDHVVDSPGTDNPSGAGSGSSSNTRDPNNGDPTRSW